MCSSDLPNLLIACLMGCVVTLVGKLAMPLILLLPLQVAVGGAVYVALSLVTRNENFYYLLDYIKTMLKRG